MHLIKEVLENDAFALWIYILVAAVAFTVGLYINFRLSIKTYEEDRKLMLNYIKNQRTELDQIAEFVYDNSASKCNMSIMPEGHMHKCRDIGVDHNGKGGFIVGELMRLYKERHGKN